MNKALVRKRFLRGLSTYDTEADVQLWAAQKVAALWEEATPKGCDKALEIGCGTGMLSELIVQKNSVRHLFLNDLVEETEPWVRRRLHPYSGTAISFLQGDAEVIAFPDSLDGIISSSAMQWFQDVPAFLEKCFQSLNSGGWFCASTFGPMNIHEIKSITGIGLEYPDGTTLRGWLEHHFEQIQVSEHVITREWDTPREVLHHLKNTGVNSLFSGSWTREKLRAFDANYQNQFGKNHKVPLTYHIILLRALKKHSTAYSSSNKLIAMTNIPAINPPMATWCSPYSSAVGSSSSSEI